MRKLIILLTFIAPLAARASVIDTTAARLSAVPCWHGTARCEIFIPNYTEPVVYELDMTSSASSADTLCPYDYLVDWQMSTPDGARSHGFTAYSAGNAFRYREGRLQEYHAADDLTPFAPGGDPRVGVARRAQFAEWLPQAMGVRLAEMAADSAYTISVAGPVIKAVERVRGYDCREITLTLDGQGLPLRLEIESNQGQPSEQTVSLDYKTLPDTVCVTPTESELGARYPDAFGKFRRDTYTVEHLPGTPLPTFSAPTPTGERFSYTRGTAPGIVWVIGVLDSGVGDPGAVVRDLREASLLSSQANKLILAFTDSDREAVEEITGQLGMDEAVLFNARSLARDCGVTLTPTVIFVGPDGRVADIIIGTNKDLRSDVLQKITLSQDK